MTQAKNGVNGFMLFTDQREYISLLDDAQQAELLRAIYAYAAGEEPQITDKITIMAFTIIRQSIDRVWSKNAALAENGRKGGQASKDKQQQAIESKAEQIEANSSNDKQGEANESKSPIKSEIKSEIKIKENLNTTRTRARRSKGSESIDAVINEQSSELIPALTEFVNHRKSMKRPLTAHALKLNIEDLQRLAPNDIARQRELIEYAIKKGWQAFYLPNDDQVYSSQTHLPKATTVAQQRSLERQMMAQMLLDDRKQQTEESRNADGSRIIAQPDGSELALPPGW